MAASSTSEIVSDLHSVSLELEDGLCDLIGAQAIHGEAQRELASVKARLEQARAELIVEGVEGSNAEAREAHIRVSLKEVYSEVFCCEDEVARKKVNLEIEQQKWNLLRYKLRALEAISKFES